MKKQMKKNVFAQKIANERSTARNPTARTLSCIQNGMSQPPKNSVDISALAVTMFAYSAMKKSENFIALYSVWYPVISSDSASGRSNGSLFVSANTATRKIKNAIVRFTTFHPP